MGRRLIIAVIIMLLLPAVYPGGNRAEAHTKTKDRPILFIHGADVIRTPQIDCRIWFSNEDAFAPTGVSMARSLGHLGWNTAKFRYISYYVGDVNCSNHGSADDTIEHHGSHSAAAGDGWDAHPSDNAGHVKDSQGNWSHNQRAYIQHLGWHLAWYIWFHYTNNTTASIIDRGVDVVAHSMGGLMIGYAMAKVQKGAEGWPPYLWVEDVITMGTPHTGTYTACGSNFPKQMDQMCPTEHDNFMIWMSQWGLDPQAINSQRNIIGTDWTLIGSSGYGYTDDGSDGTVRGKSATGENISPVTNWYRTPRHKARQNDAPSIIKRIRHPQYYQDTTANEDRDERHWNRGDGAWTHWTRTYHLVKWVNNALYFQNW